MNRFAEGDRVRVDIPDETDPGHERYHGVHGAVTDVLEDRADKMTHEGREVVGDYLGVFL